MSTDEDSLVTVGGRDMDQLENAPSLPSSPGALRSTYLSLGKEEQRLNGAAISQARFPPVTSVGTCSLRRQSKILSESIVSGIREVSRFISL